MQEYPNTSVTGPNTSIDRPEQRRPAPYRSREGRRRDLRNAVSGVDLTPRDQRLLDWLAESDQDTTGALADLIVRARAAMQGPTQ